MVEFSLEKLASKADLGLSQWNEKRFVRFHGKSLKLIKLHGSIDWYIENHDEIRIHKDHRSMLPRAMIFGGQSDKLVPYGPFLHLRHQFHQILQGSSYLLVVGYSFRDLHLNALIRSWIATRKSGKIIIVDPENGYSDGEVFRYANIVDKGRPVGKRVEIKEIKKGFAAALDEIDHELQANPILSI